VARGMATKEVALSSAAVDAGNHVISGVGRPIIPLSITNLRVTLLLLQPVDKPPTGCVGRVLLPCVLF